MAKYLNDAGLDALLDYIKNNCDKMIVCSTQPTTYAEATSTYALADVAMASGDFTHANGDTSGRKTTVAAKSAVPIDASGNAQHVALVKTGTSTLLAVTTCTSQALTAGGTVDVPAWDIEVADAA